MGEQRHVCHGFGEPDLGFGLLECGFDVGLRDAGGGDEVGEGEG